MFFVWQQQSHLIRSKHGVPGDIEGRQERTSFVDMQSIDKVVFVQTVPIQVKFVVVVSPSWVISQVTIGSRLLMSELLTQFWTLNNEQVPLGGQRLQDSVGQLT
jgi:hypothetical protein